MTTKRLGVSAEFVGWQTSCFDSDWFDSFLDPREVERLTDVAVVRGLELCDAEGVGGDTRPFEIWG